MCIITWFTDPCTGEKWCQQDVTYDFIEWDTFDCTEGIADASENCEYYCEYEDCGEDHSTDEACWVEVCDDGCGNYNCSLWYQVDGEWYGEYCPEDDLGLPEFRVGDALGAVMRAGRMYENTIEQVFDSFCAPDD